jgi:hypothetical protein
VGLSHLVEVPEPLHEVVCGVSDLLAGNSLQHGQELLEGHPRVLLVLRLLTLHQQSTEINLMYSLEKCKKYSSFVKLLYECL